MREEAGEVSLTFQQLSGHQQLILLEKQSVLKPEIAEQHPFKVEQLRFIP